MSPANSYCTRLLSSVAPSAPLRSEAPTTATDLGRNSRSICSLVKRRSLMSMSPDECGPDANDDPPLQGEVAARSADGGVKPLTGHPSTTACGGGPPPFAGEDRE